jgi:GNAT superfamily N-acetyltransferase
MDTLDMHEVTRRILRQRMERYQDGGPALGALGTARFRGEAGVLRVGFASIAPRRASDAVRVVTEFARRHRLQVQWLVVPQRAGEGELAAALGADGFTLTDDLQLMARRGPMRAPVEASAGVTVQHIGTWEAMWRYEYGSRQSFYDEAQPSEAAVTQRATERWREQERGWCRYFAAFAGGHYAGGCYISLYEDIPTVMGVYTLQQARRRGVARTLLMRVIDEIAASRDGLCCLLVERGNPAELLYRDLGFVALVDLQTFAWSWR